MKLPLFIHTRIYTNLGKNDIIVPTRKNHVFIGISCPVIHRRKPPPLLYITYNYFLSIGKQTTVPLESLQVQVIKLLQKVVEFELARVSCAQNFLSEDGKIIPG